MAVVVAVFFALAGCRFTVDPVELSLSGNAGETASETITIQNTGDESLDYTLTSSGSGFDLSLRSGTLGVGEAVDVSVSMTCGASGEVEIEGTNSEGTASVAVPVSLSCLLGGGAGLVSIEIFQGPPVFKADYETGRTYGPVSMVFPEDGSPAKEPIPWGLDWEDERQALHAAWSPDDDGFVTAVWRRQAAVAVTVRSLDDTRIPDISAAIVLDEKPTGLPQVYQETHRDGEGFLTDTVFYVARELYARGAALRISVDSEDGQDVASVTLFGEEVPPLR